MIKKKKLIFVYGTAQLLKSNIAFISYLTYSQVTLPNITLRLKGKLKSKLMKKIHVF